MREECVARQRVAIDELDTFEMSATRHQASDTTLVEPNASIRESCAHLERHGKPAVGEDADVARPAPEQQGKIERLDVCGEVSESLILNLPGMAVGTLEDGRAP